MIAPDVLAACLADTFIAAPGATLRKEDRQKVAELRGFLAEVAVHVPKKGAAAPFVLVDAAAGKSALGLLTAKLLFVPAGIAARVVIVERDPLRLAAARDAATRLALPPSIEVELVEADVTDRPVFPARPALVVALHACGPATDAVIAQTIACGARRLLLAPCCVGEAVPFFATAERLFASTALPRHAPVRGRFVRALVDAARTLALEAAGYETTIVPFTAPTVSPENLLWRARRVREPRRMQEAEQRLRRLLGGDALGALVAAPT